MATKVTSHVLSNDVLAKERNLLINGGMNVWQRSTSVTGITSGTEYRTVDRWELDIVNSFGTGAGTWTMAQSTDVPSGQGFAYSTRIDMTATGDQVGGSPINLNLVKLQQKIEGQNVQHLLKGTSSAKALTLSFWVKSTRASTFVVQFTDPTNSRNISKSYTINATNTWEKKTVLIPGDTTGTIDNDNTSGFTVEFWLFAGLGYLTGGSLATSWGANAENTYAVGAQSLVSTDDDWSITGVQLEVGEAATPFEFEPYEATERKCYRYYYAVTPLTYHPGHLDGYNPDYPLAFINFPVAMRAIPSGTMGTISNFFYRNGAAGGANFIPSGGNENSGGKTLSMGILSKAQITNAPAGGYSQIYGQWRCTGSFDAEL